MADILEVVLTVIFMFYYVCAGGYFIKKSIISFQDENYFLFGANLMLALMHAIFMAKLQFSV